MFASLATPNNANRNIYLSMHQSQWLLLCIDHVFHNDGSWRYSMPSMEHLYRWSLYSEQTKPTK